MKHIQADPPPVLFLNLHWRTFWPSDVRHKQRSGQVLRRGFQPSPETLPIPSPKVLAQQPPLSQGVPGDGPAVLGFDPFSHVSAGELYFKTRLQVTWLIPLNEGESDKRFTTAKGGGVGRGVSKFLYIRSHEEGVWPWPDGCGEAGARLIRCIYNFHEQTQAGHGGVVDELLHLVPRAHSSHIPVNPVLAAVAEPPSSPSSRGHTSSGA